MDERRHDIRLARYDIGEDAWQPGGLRLDEHETKSLVVRWEEEGIHRAAHQARHIRAGTGEDDPLPEAERGGARHYRRAQFPFPDKQEVHIRVARHHLGGDIEQQGMVLLLREAPDMTDHEGILRDMELCAHRLAADGLRERARDQCHRRASDSARPPPSRGRRDRPPLARSPRGHPSRWRQSSGASVSGTRAAAGSPAPRRLWRRDGCGRCAPARPPASPAAARGRCTDGHGCGRHHTGRAL